MRCFIAVDLDDAIKAELAVAQSYFQNSDIGGKVSWTRCDQMHLTVKFLGEVADETIPKVSNVLEDCAGKVAPFEFAVEGLGAYPPTGRQLRILWVGVTPPPGLIELSKLCENGFAQLGFRKESRRFSPHLTIGRVRQAPEADAFRQVIRQHENFSAGVQYAEHLVLYSSQLRPGGAVYISLAKMPLAGGLTE